MSQCVLVRDCRDHTGDDKCQSSRSSQVGRYEYDGICAVDLGYAGELFLGLLHEVS